MLGLRRHSRPRSGDRRKLGVGAIRYLAQDFMKVRSLAEIAIDGCKAHISHGIEAPQRLHHQLADGRGWNFALAHAFELPHDARDHALDAVRLHRTLAQSDLHGARKLVAIEGDAASRPL